MVAKSTSGLSREEFRTRRQALGLSQDGLAKALGVTTNTVARWERGAVAIPQTVALALEALEGRTRAG